mgnify:CR=1 FL=1
MTASALAPVSTDLQNWWKPENLTVGVSSSWTDAGSEGATLTKGFASDPANGTPIDGHATLDANSNQAMEHATTTLHGASEVWIVLRSDNHSTQLAFDAVGSSDRHTFFVSSNDNMSANAGSTLAVTDGFIEHRPQIVRIRVNGDTSGDIFRITDTGSSVTTAIGSGTIGSGDWTGITMGAANSGSSAWRGDIAEMLRYSDVMASGAATTAAYLLAKYPSCAKYDQTEVTLLCAGDSITAGTASTSLRSYRGQLREAFETTDVSASTTLVFRGTSEDRCMDHDGVSGETISQIDSRMAAAIAAHSPDVLVLIAGTNDCQDAGYVGLVADAAYDSLLSTIYTADNGLPVVLCLVPPLSNGTHDANVDDLNTRIEDDVVPGASSTITVVDARDYGFVAATHTTDGVHPNTLGEQALSDAIEAGIRAALA